MSLTINAIKSHRSMPSIVSLSPVGLDIAARSVSDQLLGIFRHVKPDLAVHDPPPRLEHLGPGQDVTPDGGAQKIDLQFIRHGHRLEADHAQYRIVNGHIGQGHQHAAENVPTRPQPSLIVRQSHYCSPAPQLLAPDPAQLDKAARLPGKALQRLCRQLLLSHGLVSLLRLVTGVPTEGTPRDAAHALCFTGNTARAEGPNRNPGGEERRNLSVAPPGSKETRVIRRSDASMAAYFFLWRMRRRIFLYLCFRIFFRRFLTTLPTAILLLFGASAMACRTSFTAATIAASFPRASSTVRVLSPQSGSIQRASAATTCSAFWIRAAITAGVSTRGDRTSITPKERSLENGCFLKSPMRSSPLLDISRSKLWTGSFSILG